MTRHLSIRLLAPLLLVLPAVVVAVVILMVSSRAAQKAAVEQAYGEMAQIQATVADRVNELLAVPPRAVALNLAWIDQGELDPAEPTAWRDTLLAQSRALPMLSAISYGTEDGLCTWLSRYSGNEHHRFHAILTAADDGMMREYLVSPDDEVAAEPSSRFPLDPRVRPWYVAPMQADGPAWSEPYLWVGDEANGEPTIGLSFGRPFHDGDGRPRGVVSADLSLDDISRFLEQLQIGETGACFIVDHEGRRIASSTGGSLIDAEGERSVATGSSEPMIAEVSRFAQGAGMFESQVGRDRVSVEGGDAFVMVSAVGRDAGLDWTAVSVVPEADFMAAAWETRRHSLLISLGVIGLTVLAGVAIAGWLARPVVALERHAHRIGDGEFDARIDLRQTAEFRRLSDAMNTMAADLEDRLQLRRSLTTAMEVQQNLLPQELPAIKGLDIAGTSNYCDQTGGDYYDFLEISGLEDDTVALVVGDVMGHGIAAAMLMATARGVLRSRCRDAGTTGELLTHLNELLVEVTHGRRFMNMLMATLDAEQRRLRWGRAGHDPPFIFDPNTKSYIDLDGGGLPLGVMAGEAYEEHVSDPLPIGAVLVLVTDGVFEAHNPDGAMYGKDRLRELIETHHAESAVDLAKRLERDLAAFCGDHPQEDDITYVIVKVDGDHPDA